MTKKLFEYEEKTICNFQKYMLNLTGDIDHHYQIYNAFCWARNENEEEFFSDLIHIYNNMINKYQKGDKKYYEK